MAGGWPVAIFGHGFTDRMYGAPVTGQFAVAAQMQIATFFASRGVTVIDPDGPGGVFEAPIRLPLPETLNFLS